MLHPGERPQGLRPEFPDGLREHIQSVPVPEMWPAYSALLVDAEGYVWLGEYRGREAPPQGFGLRPFDWQVFAPDGAWLGTVRMPPRFRVLEIGSDDLIVLWRNPDSGVEHVQLLRLRR